MAIRLAMQSQAREYVNSSQMLPVGRTVELVGHSVIGVVWRVWVWV